MACKDPISGREFCSLSLFCLRAGGRLGSCLPDSLGSRERSLQVVATVTPHLSPGKRHMPAGGEGSSA